MNITEELEARNISIESLTRDERETYLKMLDEVQNSQLTPEKLKEYITSMRDSVSLELVNEPEFIKVLWFNVINRKQILLKARLQNYILLLSFLDSPRRAEETLRAMLSGIGGK